MSDITCMLVARDYRGSVFSLELSLGSVAWSRRLWDTDLESLVELAEARLNGEDVPNVPDWRRDKYPDQERPDLYERHAPGFDVERTTDGQWVVTVQDESTMSIRMTTQELRETVGRLRASLDPWGYAYDHGPCVTDVREESDHLHR